MLSYIEWLDGIEALSKRLNISPRMCVLLKAINAEHALEDADDSAAGARYRMLRPVLKPLTLEAFAHKHGADVSELAHMNGYDEDANLYPGQTLIIMAN